LTLPRLGSPPQARGGLRSKGKPPCVDRLTRKRQCRSVRRTATSFRDAPAPSKSSLWCANAPGLTRLPSTFPSDESAASGWTPRQPSLCARGPGGVRRENPRALTAWPKNERPFEPRPSPRRRARTANCLRQRDEPPSTASASEKSRRDHAFTSSACTNAAPQKGRRARCRGDDLPPRASGELWPRQRSRHPAYDCRRPPPGRQAGPTARRSYRGDRSPSRMLPQARRWPSASPKEKEKIKKKNKKATSAPGPSEIAAAAAAPPPGRRGSEQTIFGPPAGTSGGHSHASDGRKDSRQPPRRRTAPGGAHGPRIPAPSQPASPSPPCRTPAAHQAATRHSPPPATSRHE